MAVINKEYIVLQKEILKKQAFWKKDVSSDICYHNLDLEKERVPLFEKADLNVSIAKYKEWIFQLIELLTERQPAVNQDMNKIKEQINDEVLEQWVKEVLAVNEYYFMAIARNLEISEWIPQFLAEHAIRPYLRVLAEVYAEELANSRPVGTCPCCGEPVRLAVLEGKTGKKVIHCPRCFASWQEKRTKCSHCGKDHDDKMTYFQLERDPSMQLYVCNDCNSYVKVIDSKQRIKIEEPALLDLNTIHLDIIAQEKGYGVTIERGSVN